MRLKLIGAVVGVLVLAVAVTASQAATIGQTVLKVTGSVNTKNAGTKKKPKGLTVKLDMRQTTTVPSDPRPATTKGFKIVFPSTWKLNSKKWPKKSRCSQARADAAKSVKPCPKASKVGTGKTTALVGEGGTIRSDLTVSAHVLTTGNIGFFISTDVPIEVDEFLIGKVSGRTLTIQIPDRIRNTDAGKSGISVLNNTLGGKAGKGKKRVNLLEATGCKGKQWRVKFSNVAEDGTKTVNIDSKCKK